MASITSILQPLVAGLALVSTAALAQADLGSRLAAKAEIGAGVQAVGADGFGATKVGFPDGVTGYPDVTYATLPGYRPLKLDLFTPPASFAAKGPRPLVVYVHGGGWMAGGPRRSGAFADWPKVLAGLAAQGYVVASVAYRFSGEAPFPAAIQDIKSAIRWLRVRAPQYNIDPARVAIWGSSAGGHLAALAGTSCGVPALDPPGRTTPRPANVETVASTARGADEASDCVQAVVTWYGIFDFAALQASPGPLSATGSGPNPAERFLGCQGPSCTAAMMSAASPTSYIDRTDPPFLLMHGSDDRTVPERQTEIFDAALRKAGVPVRKTVIAGADHSWIGATPEKTRDASRQALRESIDFIEQTIGDTARR